MSKLKNVFCANSNNKVNILITGGAGYIGSHVAYWLCDGCNPIIYDNFSNSSPQTVSNLNRCCGRELVCVNGDILDTNLLTKTIKEYNTQIVIHLAAKKSVQESEENPLLYFDQNITGTKSVLQAIHNNKDIVKKIIFSSSACVYAPKTTALTEDDPLKPNNIYGYTKLIGEMLIREFCTRSNIQHVILRYFNPIGNHPSNFYSYDLDQSTNLFPLIVKAVKTGNPLLVYSGYEGTRDGTGGRDYIPINDVASAHLASLYYKGSGTFNISTGNYMTTLELIKLFEKANNVKVPYAVLNEKRTGDVSLSYASPILANKELHWKSLFSLAEVCRHYESHVQNAN